MRDLLTLIKAGDAACPFREIEVRLDGIIEKVSVSALEKQWPAFLKKTQLWKPSYQIFFLL